MCRREAGDILLPKHAHIKCWLSEPRKPFLEKKGTLRAFTRKNNKRRPSWKSHNAGTRGDCESEIEHTLSAHAENKSALACSHRDFGR